MTNTLTDKNFYDVIIVGGGPAGSSAAFHLSQAGKRVLLIEKEHHPRYKTCGGGLSVGFLREQFPFSFDPIVRTRLKSISYAFHQYSVTIPVSSGEIGLVMRDELDGYLLAHVQAQAEVIQGTAVSAIRELPDRVEVETKDGRCFTAAYLVGADGANSVVAHALGLRPRRTMAAAIEAEVAVPPELMRRFGQQMWFIFGEVHNGYLWIFPKPDHLSVGIGALKPKPGELQKKLKAVMARYGISLEGVPLHGHPIPLYTRRERISSARALLVGDAAGLADPLSGEGIRYAIKSGRLAAEAILHGTVDRYSRDLYRRIGLFHRVSGIIALLFYYLEAPLLLLGAPNPFSTYGLMEVLSDHMSTVEFVLFSACTLPIFVITELAARLLRILGQARLSDRLRALVYPQEVRGVEM